MTAPITSGNDKNLLLNIFARSSSSLLSVSGLKSKRSERSTSAGGANVLDQLHSRLLFLNIIPQLPLYF